MSYYLTFDAEDVLNGRYFTGINGDDIPKGALEVSEELFKRTISEIDGVWKFDREVGEAKKFPLLKLEPYVPQKVSRAQGKAALIQASLWSRVEAYVDAIIDPTEKALALVALNDTTHWHRDSPTMHAIAAGLGITSEEMDDLFIQADGIVL